MHLSRAHAALPKELFNNCSEEGREIKPQSLVSCGEATCFSQAIRILQLSPGLGITQLQRERWQRAKRGNAALQTSFPQDAMIAKCRGFVLVS